MPLPIANDACRCEVCGLETAVTSLQTTTPIVAESPAIRAVFLRVADFAQADAPVMIQGESGTGKEIVARALHANGPRRDGPFVALNVAAVPGELLESELFGHVRGAFTGATQAKQGLLEAASGGTLFLDEVAEMPLPLQAKLLRAVQEGEVRRVGDTRVFGVDVRFVCATHRDLQALVAAGRFREDLYYRLDVLTVRVPPLRERREDVLALARSFLAAEKRPASGFSPDAERALAAHAWPGNVRELRNAVKHGCALARGGVLRLEHLPDRVRAPSPRPSPPACAGGDGAPGVRGWTSTAPATSTSTSTPTATATSTSTASFAAAARSSATPPSWRLADVEREHVLEVLERCGGSHQDAARLLGIGRTTLWRKLKAWGVADEARV